MIPQFSRLIESYTKQHPDRAGNHFHGKQCFYDAKTEPNLVLLDGFFQMNESEINNLISDTGKMSNKGIDVARVHDYEIKGAFNYAGRKFLAGYLLCDLAPGVQVIRPESYVNSTQSAIDKLIYSIDAVKKHGYIVDSCGCNLFYDAKSDRFTLIDIIPKKNSLWKALDNNFVNSDFASTFSNFLMCRFHSNKTSAYNLLKLNMNFPRVLLFEHERAIQQITKKMVNNGVKRLPEIIRKNEQEYKENCRINALKFGIEHAM